MFCACANIAYAQDTSTQQAKKNRLEQEISVLDRQLAGIRSKSKSALSELTLINKKISVQKSVVAETENNINRINAEMRRNTREMEKMQNNLDTLYKYYTRLVKSAYKNREPKIWYMYILASENVGQAFRRYGYFKNLSVNMKAQAESIREVQKEIELKQKELEQIRQKERQEREVLASELESLKVEQKKADKVVVDLKKNRRKYEKEINQKRKEVNALNREIEQIISKAISGKSPKAKVQIDYALAAEFSKNKGKLPWPVNGSVIDHYGVRYHPVYKNLKLPSNDGITVVVEKNATVKAIFDGVVKQIAVMPGYNKCILLQHGNYFSLYCKMDMCNVKAGDKVKTGDVLGTVIELNGETQFHFQIWKGQSTQNPETWLRPQ